MMNLCKECGKETSNPKFCSCSCSATFNNRGKNRHGTTLPNCKNCKKKLIRSDKIYCDNNCQNDYQHKQYIKRWMDGKEDGNVGLHRSYISSHVRRWLHEQRGSNCWECGWGEINTFTGKVPLQANHINGNWRDTVPENLELICPNCHSLTEHFGARNNNGRRKVHEGTA